MQKRLLFATFGGCLLLLASGCASIGYYSQAAKGQLTLLAAREPVTRLVAQSDTDPRLKAQLILSQQILAFAQASGLPVEKSYSHYVDLQRPFVVWNVFAAEPNSTELISHCFPIAGCVGYKGYFSKERAQAFADTLAANGKDVFVGGVSAYSTLGWFNDPLLNTFIYRADERLAAVLFHELAHKVLYVEGDTVFNESFATAVERYLLERWLSQQQKPELFEHYLASRAREAQVIDLILSTREALSKVFAETQDVELIDQRKHETILALKNTYQSMQADWQQGDEFSRWMAQDLNNAHLAAIGTYHAQVPGFNRMLAQMSLDQFFEAVKRLARLEKAKRDEALAVR